MGGGHREVPSEGWERVIPGSECAGSLETKQKDLDLMGGEIGTLPVP